MDETDIMVGGLLSQIAAICEDVEVVVVAAGVASDGVALAEVRQKLMDAVALVDAVGGDPDGAKRQFLKLSSFD